MADNFLGEIRVFSFSYAPVGWADCNGQTLPIPQNVQLFSLLGNRYGGDGRTNFALPDLQGAAVVSQGQGQGLLRYDVGDKGGAPDVTLRESEIPGHTHQGRASSEPADIQSPGPDRSLARSSPGFAYQGNASEDLVRMSPQASSTVGSGAPHNNMPPSQVLRYCIALQGIFPNRG